jgi:hypoxanthine phosphoribosyltransferase
MVSEKRDLNLLHLGWEDVQYLTEKTADQIRERGFKPDIIVAVSRGGFDPARILCDQLSVQRLASIQIEFYASVNEKKGSPRVIYPLNADVTGLRVLVVDDVSDSGESLSVALEHVKSRGALEVQVATIHIKPWTAFRPHYFAEEVESWIVYPWEPLESIRSIKRSLRSRGLSDTAIQDRLLKLGFNSDAIDKVG